MTKTTRDLASAAEDSFHKHYSAIWGYERWHGSLYDALAEPTRYATLMNQYASIEDFWQSIDNARIPREELQQLYLPELDANPLGTTKGLLCFARGTRSVDGANSLTIVPSDLTFPPPQPVRAYPSKLLTHWNLDAASALVAHLLDVQPWHSVLDLCAAPGGKSIALSQKLWPAWYANESDLHTSVLGGGMGKLHANESDSKRQKRLLHNLLAYLPPHLVKQGQIESTQVDATVSSPIIQRNAYDRVLVDAPCSSERHIIHAHLNAKASGKAAPEMTNWRQGSSKRLAKVQVDLLMTALRSVKVGGKVVYATCSIETTENDNVIERVLHALEKERKKGAQWHVKLGFGDEMINAQVEKWAEKTSRGYIILPDNPQGGKWGPLFFCLLTKILKLDAQ